MRVTTAPTLFTAENDEVGTASDTMQSESAKSLILSLLLLLVTAKFYIIQCIEIEITDTFCVYFTGILKQKDMFSTLQYLDNEVWHTFG